MKSGIYQITSLAFPDRLYIGSALNVGRRQQNHLTKLEQGTHPNTILQRHYNKYGKSDLVFTLVKSVLPLYLILWEQHYIDTLRPSFNICKVAGNTHGRPQSEETKAKRIASRIKNNKGNNNIKPALQDFNGFKLMTENYSMRPRTHLYACPVCHRPTLIKDTDTRRGSMRSHCGCAYIGPYKKKIKPQKPIKPGVRTYTNLSGYMGVVLDPWSNTYRARLKVNRKLLDLGRYPTALQAHNARQAYIQANNIQPRKTRLSVSK